MAILVPTSCFCLVLIIKMLSHLSASGFWQHSTTITTTKWPLFSKSSTKEKYSWMMEERTLKRYSSIKEVSPLEKIYQILIFQRSMNLPTVTFQGVFTQENWLNVSKNGSSPKAKYAENCHYWPVWEFPGNPNSLCLSLYKLTRSLLSTNCHFSGALWKQQ